jgi:hypothetical protein
MPEPSPLMLQMVEESASKVITRILWRFRISPGPLHGEKSPSQVEWLLRFSVQWYLLMAVDMAVQGTKPNDHLTTHMGHCVEYLRQPVMCSGPDSERTFEGVLGSFEANNTHLCRDYGKLAEWANDKAYRGP